MYKKRVDLPEKVDPVFRVSATETQFNYWKNRHFCRVFFNMNLILIEPPGRQFGLPADWCRFDLVKPWQAPISSLACFLGAITYLFRFVQVCVDD